MKVQLESTTKIVRVNGIEARIWEGTTERGVPIHCFITRIAVHSGTDAAELAIFEEEFTECRPPSAEMAVYPARLVL